jgi:short-subunit dehydrogenase
MDAKSRVIVITGASGGIGAALARKLATEGARLVLAARREAELERVAAEARDLGAAGALPVVADVTVREKVFELRDRAIEEFGEIDVWVNNAGRGITRSVLDLTDRDVDEMVTVNLKSAIYGMQAAARYFIERGAGHLINVSSFLGRVPIATPRSAYSAAKAALNSLTANLRMDLRGYPDIHVSLIMPGMVATDFARHALGDARPPMNAPAANAPQAGQATHMVQTADEVAAYIADVIRHPVAEVYTNPASVEAARRYYADVGAFERDLGRFQPAVERNVGTAQAEERA